MHIAAFVAGTGRRCDCLSIPLFRESRTGSQIFGMQGAAETRPTLVQSNKSAPTTGTYGIADVEIHRLIHRWRGQKYVCCHTLEAILQLLEITLITVYNLLFSPIYLPRKGPAICSAPRSLRRPMLKISHYATVLALRNHGLGTTLSISRRRPLPRETTAHV
jgi:hypothetical protein